MRRAWRRDARVATPALARRSFKAGILTAEILASTASVTTLLPTIVVNASAVPAELAMADSAARQKWLYISYGLAALTAMLAVLVIAWRAKIAIAVGVIREASKAMQRMPGMALVPIVSTIAVAAVALYWYVRAVCWPRLGACVRAW